jgi:hypothetical protein
MYASTPGWLVRPAEAAQIGSHDAPPALGEQSDLQTPGVPAFREAVQQQDQLAVGIARLDIAQPHAVGEYVVVVPALLAGEVFLAGSGIHELRTTAASPSEPALCLRSCLRRRLRARSAARMSGVE